MPTPRYASRVVTRVALSTVLSAADENAVEDRIVQLSADIGGPPSELVTADKTSLVDAINELALATQAIVVPAASFRPGSNLLDVSSNGTRISHAENLIEDFLCGLQLPHGMPIDSLTLYGDLTDAASEVSVVLLRWEHADPVGAGEVGLGTASYTGGTGNFSNVVTGIGHTVDNTQYSYGLRAELNNNPGSPNSALLHTVIIGR